MRRVNALDIFEHARKLHADGNLDGAERIYHQLLTHNINHLDFVLQIAQIHAQRGNHGLAIVLYKTVLEAHPELAKIWNNLGISLKLSHYNQSAELAFQRAFELEPDNVDFVSNISSIYVNAGEPDKIIEWADKAIALGPKDHAGVVQAEWHKALGLLEKKIYAQGWDCAEARLKPNSGCKVEVRNYRKDGTTHWWDGKSNGLVVVHGEQGLGDEIMFSSCLPDAVKTGAGIIFECAPRLESLFKRSFPEVEVIGTHNVNGEDLGGRHVDYKCAIGSLARFYRRSESDFPGKSFLIPDPQKVELYRERLESLGSRPKIGIGWQGGVIKTRVDLRSLFLQQLLPVLNQEADFLSLQYTPAAPEEVERFFSDTGIVIHHWPEAATGLDMDDQAALVANLDLVISVCQTNNHVSGGLGVPCWVLTPSRPSWREGMHGDMPWYRSVKLYRQIGDDWEGIISTVATDLKGTIDAYQRKLQGTEQAVA